MKALILKKKSLSMKEIDKVAKRLKERICQKKMMRVHAPGDE